MMADKAAPTWRNRIVGHGDEDPTQLLANPRNWRVHPKGQQDALTGALDQVGWVQQVVVNTTTGHMVDGHLRVEMALSRGEPAVPVVYVELTPEEEGLVLASLDPIGAMAATDDEKLRQLLAEVAFDSHALESALGELLTATPATGLTDPDDAPEPSAAPWVKPGDLFALGRHRLLCGDSTRPEDVARVMGGQLAVCVWTDPPYGVAIGDKHRRMADLTSGGGNTDRIAGDGLGDDAALSDLLGSAFDNAMAHTAPGGAWYVSSSPGATLTVFAGLLRARGIWRQSIAWVKNTAALASLGADLHPRWELIFYGWVPGAAHRWYGGRKQDTVWEVARPTKNADHPTMKPVALVVRSLENSTSTGDVVLDVFAGSGTTILAAEQIGRAACAIELEPRYVQVAIERWEAFTGQQAVKLDSEDA